VRPDGPLETAVRAALEVLQRGGIVAFPTETVYGLTVDGGSAEAVEGLFRAKGRDARKACAYLVADVDAARRLVGGRLPRIAERLARRFWPGPVTLLVPGRRGRLVGLRVPNHPVALALARAAPRPLLQTSANRSGEPAALNAAGVAASLSDRIDLLLDAGRTPGGRSSTVVRCQGDRFAIVRQGAVPAADVIRAATELILVACTGNLCRSPVAEAALRAGLAERLACEVDDLVRFGYRLGSFGTMAMAGHPASEHSITTAAEHGLDLRAHRSRPFSIGLLKQAERVYVMSRNHRDFLVPYFDDPDVVELLDPRGKEIRDPYGRALKVYRRAAEQILEAVETRADEILGLAGDGEDGEDGERDGS